jgi:hypothetical protein
MPQYAIKYKEKWERVLKEHENEADIKADDHYLEEAVIANRKVSVHEQACDLGMVI